MEFEDWSHFVNSVQGGVCISGRRCYEELGQAMPGAALHIVLSKKGLKLPDALVKPSLQEAIEAL